MDRLISLNNTVYYNPNDWLTSSKLRKISVGYDEFGRTKDWSVRTDESGSNVLRGFDVTYNDGSGVYTVTGPESQGVDTSVTLDAAGP